MRVEMPLSGTDRVLLDNAFAEIGSDSLTELVERLLCDAAKEIKRRA